MKQALEGQGVSGHHLQVQIIMSLENLGKRKPRRGRLPAHHDGVWIPTPGFSTADPLPGWWMAVIGAGSPARVSEALADWPRSSGGEEGVSFSLGSLAEPFPCKGEQEPSGQQFAGPDDGFVRQEEQVATDVAEEVSKVPWTSTDWTSVDAAAL